MNTSCPTSREQIQLDLTNGNYTGKVSWVRLLDHLDIISSLYLSIKSRLHGPLYLVPPLPFQLQDPDVQLDRGQRRQHHVLGLAAAPVRVPEAVGHVAFEQNLSN